MSAAATSASVPDIGCGHHLGDTSCILPFKHGGDHQPAEVVTVDRRLRPLNRQRVRRVGRREVMFAAALEYKGKAQVRLVRSGGEESGGKMSSLSVNRPAVRIGSRWLRRCPNLEVLES